MWEIDLSQQAITFLLSLFLGVIFCLIFDFTRALRIFGINSKIAVFFTDVIYFLVISFVNFCFFLTRESGQVRGYVFVGEIIGFFAFRLTLSKIVMVIMAFFHKLYIKLKHRINRVKSKIYLKFKEKFYNSKLFSLKLQKKVKKPLKKG